MKTIIFITLNIILLSSLKAQNFKGEVIETLVFDNEVDDYVSSEDGLVEQPYSKTRVKKKGKNLSFIFYFPSDSVSFSNYTIDGKGMDSYYTILATKNSDGQQIIIKIIGDRMLVNCQYNSEADRFDGMIVISNFNKNIRKLCKD